MGLGEKWEYLSGVKWIYTVVSPAGKNVNLIHTVVSMMLTWPRSC